MGLFGRDERTSEGSSRPSSPAATPSQGPVARAGAALTVIAKGCRVDGRISGAGDVHVEGELHGEVATSATLIVAEEGRVEATLHARAVVVAGRVSGDVSADERIELKPTANLTGNIGAPRILIHDGATFEGQVEMKATDRRQSIRPEPTDGPPASSSKAQAAEGKGSRAK